MANDSYLGIKYPVENSEVGNYVKMTRTGRQAVKSNLTFLLSTQKGEVLYNPDFGVDIAQYMFEPLDDKSIEDIKNEILSAVQLHLKGVSVDSIRATNNDTTNSVDIEIEFSFNEGVFKASDIIKLSF